MLTAIMQFVLRDHLNTLNRGCPCFARARAIRYNRKKPVFASIANPTPFASFCPRRVSLSGFCRLRTTQLYVDKHLPSPEVEPPKGRKSLHRQNLHPFLCHQTSHITMRQRPISLYISSCFKHANKLCSLVGVFVQIFKQRHAC